MEATELAVIGPGAIGTWLAWRLSAAAPVQLIGRRRGWLTRARRGVQVHAAKPAGLPPRPSRIRTTLSPSGRPAAVFVCVKSQDTAGALRHALRLAGPETPVVSLQNGLTHLGATTRALGARRAVFGACYAAVLRDGAAVRHQTGQLVHLGVTRSNRAAARAARRWLLRAGLDAPPAGREDRVLWTKAVFNAATNPVGALTARTNGDLAAVPALWDITLAALREGERAARAAGHPTLPRDLAGLVRRACAAAPKQENSMLQDLRAGRPTEVEAILGPLLAAARRRGLRAPVLSSLRRFMRRLELELTA